MARASNNVRDRQAVDELFSLAYEELRRLAATIRRHDAHATINPTGLVNEAWIKVAKSPPAGVASPLHFKRVAARAMRQVLVEAARRRQAGKRGGSPPMVTFDESLAIAEAGAGDVVALDAALDALAVLSRRQAAIVEGRFFGGLDVAELAAALQISEATVLRDWRAARAWLARTLREDG